MTLEELDAIPELKEMRAITFEQIVRDDRLYDPEDYWMIGMDRGQRVKKRAKALWGLRVPHKKKGEPWRWVCAETGEDLGPYDGVPKGYEDVE